ncbi:MAG: 2-oxoacid:acceptor oxidoreductase subunit alpha [Candidatus Neomarinimicrobiota bacterium]
MPKTLKRIDDVTIRFAGDSGDGMQLTGDRFTSATAIIGNDLSTLPDYPAEIRAPAGSLAGVSAFQLHFSSHEIFSPGDDPDVLVAMNPAALKVHLPELVRGGTVILNTASFTPKNIKLAQYNVSPLDDNTLKDFVVYPVDMSLLVTNACADMGLSPKIVERTKNMFALGILYWMYNRPVDTTIQWLKDKFAHKPDIIEANTRALNAGYNYGSTNRIFTTNYKVDAARLKPGVYRNISGNFATALGLVAAAKKAGLNLFYGSYPITPASDILHHLADMRNYGVRTFQAEDEIAGITSAIGAAFAGSLAASGTSGPGLALKSEALGLAVMTELPLVIINVQRGGPATGLPTKTEQADLFQAIYGRNGEAPIPVISARSPGDCFTATYEAARVALKYMTPVIVLTDGYVGNGSEPWSIPSVDELPEIKANFFTKDSGQTYQPYGRDETTLARKWVVPGTPGLEHRIGGLEKENGSGDVNYSPENHHLMVTLRARKVAQVADDISPCKIIGDESGDILIVSWGSTRGACRAALQKLRAAGKSVSHMHLRWLNPLPRELGDILKRFKKIFVPEINLGQLATVLRSRYLIEPHQLNLVRGRPFLTREIIDAVNELIDG